MEGDGAPMSSNEERINRQYDNAIRAIREKKPLPEIDFTIHTMEDGTQVSTLERVCKGKQESRLPCHRATEQDATWKRSRRPR